MGGDGRVTGSRYLLDDGIRGGDCATSLEPEPENHGKDFLTKAGKTEVSMHERIDRGVDSLFHQLSPLTKKRGFAGLKTLISNILSVYL